MRCARLRATAAGPAARQSLVAGQQEAPGNGRNRGRGDRVELVMTQPDYDVTMENTAELIGPLPAVAPPVLADWTVADPDGGWW